VKAKVVQTFYVPRTGQLYKKSEEVIEVDPTFAHTYSTCLSIIGEKTATAPLNKMVTTEKEIIKTVQSAINNKKLILEKKPPAKRGKK